MLKGYPQLRFTVLIFYFRNIKNGGIRNVVVCPGTSVLNAEVFISNKRKLSRPNLSRGNSNYLAEILVKK